MSDAAHPFLETHPLMTFLIVYYSCTNLITFALYGVDKAAARAQKSRVSERILHSWSAAGGALGALYGQSFFRHKTQKIFFKWFSCICLALHIVLIALLAGSSEMIKLPYLQI